MQANPSNRILAALALQAERVDAISVDGESLAGPDVAEDGFTVQTPRDVRAFPTWATIQ
ncbi:MAG: hypothetical protein AAGA88_07490 [Pseudomonadota bacterium]